MGEEYMSCNLSQSSLADLHLPTFSLTVLGNPSQMKSIAIFLFFFNSFLAAVFSLFELSHPITIVPVKILSSFHYTSHTLNHFDHHTMIFHSQSNP
jgi:hypothetical protein